MPGDGMALGACGGDVAAQRMLAPTTVSAGQDLRSARISGSGTNPGRSRSMSAGRAIHWSSLVRLLPPRQLPGMRRVGQLHVQPCGLQQVIPDLPVTNVDSMTTSCTPLASGRAASARIALVVAGTSSTRDARRPPSPSRCR